MNHISEFRDAIAATGLVPPDDIIDDGKIRRFSSSGRKGDTAGWYILHGDGIPAGRFGCNRDTDIDVKWSQKQTTPLTDEQKREYAAKMRDAKRMREAEQAIDRERAAMEAADLWAHAIETDDHPYLKRKGITGLGVRVIDVCEITAADKETGGYKQITVRNAILVPLRHGPGALVGLQIIKPDGAKFFLNGTPSQGAYHVIGKPSKLGPIVICEGYATAMSVHMATGYCCVVAISAGNLLMIARKIRAALPAATIYIAADDDAWTDGNPGIMAAQAAAAEIQAFVAIPVWNDARPTKHTDFNDLHADEGIEAVKRCFLSTEPGPTSDKSGRQPAASPSVDRASVPASAGTANTGSSASMVPSSADEGAAVVEPDRHEIPVSAGDDQGPDVPDYYFPEEAFAAPGPGSKVSTAPVQELLPALSDEYAPQCSDDDLASQHIKRMQSNALWSEMWGRWLFWRGDRWIKDETNFILDMVRQTCRKVSLDVLSDASLDAGKRQRQADKIASYRTITNVERLSRTFREVATHPDEWDRDLWALNTPGGVVDLRTGILRAHSIEDRFTKITKVAPDGDCPTWLSFLNTATAGNQDLIAFLKRMCGYSLTGEIREHALFFVYGTGGNGKGTFLNTITKILGDYQQVASAETFTESHNDRHTTELASLQSARLVTAQETEEGKRWAESRIKSLTGGDPITARYMRQDNFTFIPQFKLVIVGNHKPAFRNVDEAIKRRLHLIPFTAVIANKDKDPLLARKLEAEAPGILKWMIEGCVEWARDGLHPPSIVKESTDEYLDAEDALQQWIDECCDIDGRHFGASSALFASWTKFCEDTGEYVGSQKRLMARLESRGIKIGQKFKGTRGCVGIRLKNDDAYPF